LHVIYVTKVEPSDALEMVLIENNLVYNNEASVPHVGIPKQHETSTLNNYIYQDNGKNIVTKTEKPENVCDQINTLINKAYEKKPN